MVAIYHWVIDGEAPFDSIAHLLDRLWDEELKDYDSLLGLQFHHTFQHLAKVANWLNSGADWSADDYVSASKTGLGTGWRVSATHERDDARRAPAPGEYPKMRMSFLDGTTLDVTGAAKAAGFSCPVAVTMGVWKDLIEDDSGLECGSEEKSLAYLLGYVAGAYTGEGKDVCTWLRAVGGQGELEVANIKAIHGLDANDARRLTIMMDWEENV